MIDLATYLMFVAASAAIVIVPGPTVTVIIANSLRQGTSAGFLNIAGTQAGIIMMILILAAGLTTIVNMLSVLFEIVRWLGAGYLIWLGLKLWCADGSLASPSNKDKAERSRASFFWQGFLVIWSNPKALVFFGAFIPQFVDPTAAAFPQVVLLGLTFMAVATIFDGGYALAAGRAGALLSKNNIRWLERISGTCLIGGGIWLALARRS